MNVSRGLLAGVFAGAALWGCASPPAPKGPGTARFPPPAPVVTATPVTVEEAGVTVVRTTEAAPLAPKPSPSPDSIDAKAATVAPEPPAQTPFLAKQVPRPRGDDAGEEPASAADVIYFGSDAYRVAPQYHELLAEHARRLKADPSRRLQVRGHTDAEGPPDYNLALSKKRVEMVIRTLVSLGVNRKQLEPHAYADRRPAAGGEDAAAWARNRRVELVYR